MKSKDIAKALFILLEQGVPQDQIFQAFTKFVKVNHFEGVVPKILWYLEYFSKEKESNSSLKIISAHDVSNDTLDEIKKYIGVEKETKVQNKIQKDVIGGFIAYYSGKEYDASIKKQLSRLKQAIINN